MREISSRLLVSLCFCRKSIPPFSTFLVHMMYILSVWPSMEIAMEFTNNGDGDEVALKVSFLLNITREY